MALPFFFAEKLVPVGEVIELDDVTSRHIVQVLRMKEGASLHLTDGKGTLAEGAIANAHKKHCRVRIVRSDLTPRHSPRLTIGMSLIKNTSRFEWFLEKATELGTARIIPLLCERTEKQKLRYDRFLNICTSAMLQSTQVWLPELDHARPFAEVITEGGYAQQFIAHCTAKSTDPITSVFNPNLESQVVLIGPEGDFTDSEIAAAFERGFSGVSLGSTRLRTETAGTCVAAVCRRY